MKYWHLSTSAPGYDAALSEAASTWNGPGALSINEKCDGTQSIVKVDDDAVNPAVWPLGPLVASYDAPPRHLVAHGWYPE